MSTKTTKLGLPLIPEAEYDTKKVIDMIKENQGTASDSAFNKIDSFASDIDTRVNSKQEKLVSGQNIKTINGKSVLGTGDVEIPVPTKVSDLTNDSKFITNSVGNLVNYYVKADVYTKTEIDNTLATFSKLKLTVVDSLPTTGEPDTIYLVPADSKTEHDYYNEYIWLSNKWELLGNTKIDLSDYYKKSEADSKFATKADVQAVDAKIPSLDGYATETYVNNHHDSAKVDTADFKFKTINSQSILGTGNIVVEAAEQVQADWAETDESSKAYIKNKPTVPSGQIQADWNQADTAATDFIKNKPEIPEAVSVSKTGSSAEEVKYITIGENEYKLPSGGTGGSIAFADITGEATDNESLAGALDNKQDLLPDAAGNNGKVLTVENDQITWAPAGGLPSYTDADAGKVLSITLTPGEKVLPEVPLKLKDHYSKEELADFVQQYNLDYWDFVGVYWDVAKSDLHFELYVCSDIIDDEGTRGNYQVWCFIHDSSGETDSIDAMYLFADDTEYSVPENGWYDTKTYGVYNKMDQPPEIVIPQCIIDAPSIDPDIYAHISDISELTLLFDLAKAEPGWNKEIAFEHTSESGTVSSSTTAGGFTAAARSRKNGLIKDKLTTTILNDLGVQIAAIEEHDKGCLQTDLAISSDKIYYSKNGVTEDGKETHINVTEPVEDILVNWKEFIEASMAESSMADFGECDTMTLDFTENDMRKLGVLLSYLDIEED